MDSFRNTGQYAKRDGLSNVTGERDVSRAKTVGAIGTRPGAHANTNSFCIQNGRKALN